MGQQINPVYHRIREQKIYRLISQYLEQRETLGQAACKRMEERFDRRYVWQS